MERVAGIEPASQPWEGRVLPLNHTRFAAEHVRKRPYNLNQTDAFVKYARDLIERGDREAVVP